MGKFINPFTDIGFKRIFGQEISKPLLLDFLNNLLKGEKVITNITFLDKEQPSEYRDDRSLIYDVFCETDDNERIIVEMQNRESIPILRHGACTMPRRQYPGKAKEARSGGTTSMPFT